MVSRASRRFNRHRGRVASGEVAGEESIEEDVEGTSQLLPPRTQNTEHCILNFYTVLDTKLTGAFFLQDNVIIAIRGEGLVEDDEDQANTAAPSGTLSYALHPNCGIFDDE